MLGWRERGQGAVRCQAWLRRPARRRSCRARGDVACRGVDQHRVAAGLRRHGEEPPTVGRPVEHVGLDVAGERRRSGPGSPPGPSARSGRRSSIVPRRDVEDADRPDVPGDRVGRRRLLALRLNAIRGRPVTRPGPTSAQMPSLARDLVRVGAVRVHDPEPHRRIGLSGTVMRVDDLWPSCDQRADRMASVAAVRRPARSRRPSRGPARPSWCQCALRPAGSAAASRRAAGRPAEAAPQRSSAMTRGVAAPSSRRTAAARRRLGASDEQRPRVGRPLEAAGPSAAIGVGRDRRSGWTRRRSATTMSSASGRRSTVDAAGTRGGCRPARRARLGRLRAAGHQWRRPAGERVEREHVAVARGTRSARCGAGRTAAGPGRACEPTTTTSGRQRCSAMTSRARRRSRATGPGHARGRVAGDVGHGEPPSWEGPRRSLATMRRDREGLVSVVGRRPQVEVLQDGGEVAFEAAVRGHATCPPGTGVGAGSGSTVDRRIAARAKWSRDLAVPRGMPRDAATSGSGIPRR